MAATTAATGVGVAVVSGLAESWVAAWLTVQAVDTSLDVSAVVGASVELIAASSTNALAQGWVLERDTAVAYATWEAVSAGAVGADAVSCSLAESWV